MDPSIFPISISITTVQGSTSLPATPWIKLRDLERYLIGRRLIPLEWEEIEGERIISAKAFLEIDRWITNCGFSGVSFMGQPVVAHTEDPLGTLQEIPTVYFRKLRGVYSDALSRVSVEQNEDEMSAADVQDAAGFGEPDWREVIVNRAELVAYVARVSSHIDGSPRPAESHNKGRASLQGIHRAVSNLVRRHPAATIRQADELALSLGASRSLVREELRKARSKTGVSVKVGRPRKKPLHISMS